MELPEAVIKALERISVENPRSVLTQANLDLLLNMADFFMLDTQLKIMQTVTNSVKGISSEEEFTKYAIPLLPALNNFFRVDGSIAA